LTNYTASTSETLQALQNLNDVLEAQPANPTGQAAQAWDSVAQVSSSVITSIWDDLYNRIKDALSGVITSIETAIGTALDSASTTITTAVGAIVKPVKDVVDGIKGTLEGFLGDVQGWFEGVIGKITDAIHGVSDWITNTINNVQAWIGNAVQSASQWVTQTITNVRDWISNAVNTTIYAVRDWITNAYNNVRDWIVNAYYDVSDWVRSAISSASTWVQDTYQNVASWIRDALDNLTKAWQTIKETVEDKIQAILEWIEKAKANIVEWWHGVLLNISNFIYDKIIPAWDTAVEGAKGIVGIAKIVWEAISSGDYTKAFGVVDDFFKGIGLPAPMQVIWSILSAIAYFWETIHLQFIGMEYNAQKQAVINLGLEPIDLSTAANAVYKGLWGEGDYIANARLGGVKGDKAETALQANRPLPSAGQVQAAFLRGEITLEEHDNYLKHYGLSVSNIELIKQLYMVIPGVGDLIHMAVREAFTPEIAQKFGQYQDYPEEFTQWAQKQGLSKEWSTRYWAAHWELPSASMGFEMLHRGVIDDDELKLLLRALDVMPYWRERLIDISYNPLTRVDVRRMYQLGVIDQAQVKRSYLDLGYDDQKAEWLTEFTIRYYTPEDQNQQDEFKTMARTTYSGAYKKHIISEDEYRQFLLNLKYYPDDVELLIQIDNYQALQTDKLFDLEGYRKDWLKIILNAYDRGLLHENEVKPMLIDLGYSEEEASMEISLSDYNRQLAIQNLVVNQVHDQYVTYIIDETGMNNMLNAFNFTAEEILKLQADWQIERTLRTKKPSLSDLKGFFKAGLLSLDELMDEIRGLGYNEKYIPMYAQTLGT
jgi:ABC-type proline/glycine betaine transport system permease subunit